ncbi:MAG: SRPBCC domain-containing protein [Chitinophagales bacterium]|nr:SRPBCC domain-containing protein [Chitinophagales bacterium]
MSKAPKTLTTSIVIHAAPSKVWQVLTDFEKYPQWNPFIKYIKGAPVVGGKIEARIEPPGAKGMVFRPKVLVFQANKQFRWKGHLLVPALFDGEHIFELQDNGDGSTTLVHQEIFTGVLVPLFKKMLDENTLQGFEAMNKKLKSRVETGDLN